MKTIRSAHNCPLTGNFMDTSMVKDKVAKHLQDFPERAGWVIKKTAAK